MEGYSSSGGFVGMFGYDVPVLQQLPVLRLDRRTEAQNCGQFNCVQKGTIILKLDHFTNNISTKNPNNLAASFLTLIRIY